MNLLERITSKTPTFFRRIRNIGLTLVAIGGAILTLPVSLPAAIVGTAGYLITAGTIAATVAQTVYPDSSSETIPKP